MKKSKILPAILGAATIASSIALPYNTFATSKTAEVKITIPESISLTLSNNNLNLDLSDTDFHTDSLTVTGTTNSAAGYTISFNANNDYNDLKHSNTLVADLIPSITEDKTASTFPQTAWGYSAGTETFSQIPLTAQSIFETSVKGQSSHTFTAGAKAAATTAAGEYENELLFTIVANPTSPQDNMYIMQNIAEWKDTLELEQQIQVKDARDNKIYWVSKLKDGNIWMTQNLDYDLNENITLTPADSDVTENWTPVRSTLQKFDELNNWVNDESAPYSFNPGEYYFNGIGESYNSMACNYFKTITCEHFSTTPYSSNGEHGHVGNYYNWAAAIAMNDTSAITATNTDINTSICPAGWRLPSGYGGNNGNEIGALNNAYGGSTIEDSALIANPIYFVRSGTIGEVSTYSSDSNRGTYWTATTSAYTDFTIFVDFSSTYTITTSSGRHNSGMPIRCVAR